MLLAIMACGSQVKKAERFTTSTADSTTYAMATATSTAVEDSLLREEEPDAFLDCFVLIADTGMNYFSLREQMLQLHQQLRQPIDTLGRTYDVSESAIVYADSFATEADNAYFPRRYPDSSLSLEYLRAYTEHTDQKTMALVTGIYADKKDAEAAMARLKVAAGKAFLVPATVYLGCMN